MTVADWINPLVAICTALITGYIAWIAHTINKRDKTHGRFAETILNWQNLNSTAIADERILSIDAQNHPFGELSIDEARKMYWYFYFLNSARAAFGAWKADLLDDHYVNAYLNNTANVLHRDRDFVRRNCFTRGYPTLPDEIERRWAIIDVEGKPLEIGRILTKKEKRQRFFHRALHHSPRRNSSSS